MSEAKKYDRSYKEQSVKPALEIGVKRAGEELKVPYGTLYGCVQAAKKGIYTDTTKTKKSQRTQKYPQYVMDMLRHLHASMLINAGVDVVAVSGDLGHSQASTTTNIYCHMFQEAQARTSRAIADALIVDKKEKQGGEKAEFPA